MLQAGYAAGRPRGSVRRASGLVLTDYPVTWKNRLLNPPPSDCPPART